MLDRQGSNEPGPAPHKPTYEGSLEAGGSSGDNVAIDGSDCSNC